MRVVFNRLLCATLHCTQCASPCALRGLAGCVCVLACQCVCSVLGTVSMQPGLFQHICVRVLAVLA